MRAATLPHGTAARLIATGSRPRIPLLRPTPEPSVTVRRVTMALLSAVLAFGGLAEELVAQSGTGRVQFFNRDGERRTDSGVTVLSETLDEIKYARSNGSNRTLKTNTVISVQYGAGTAAYDEGLSALAQGNTEITNALSLLVRASKETDPPWVAAAAQLAVADAESRIRGGERKAAAAIDAFLTRFVDHRRTPEALLAKARYLAAAGDLSGAGQAIAAVKALAQANRISPDWKPRSSLVYGELLLAAEDTRQAKEQFAEAERAVGLAGAEVTERPDLSATLDILGLQARVGTASVMLAGGDVAGARTYYNRLAQDGKDDPAVAIAAANGLAECDYRAGGRLKQAQYGFAKAAVIAAGVPDEHARALYYLGRCASDLGADGREPKGPILASVYFKEVQARYPDTKWARLAQQAQP